MLGRLVSNASKTYGKNMLFPALNMSNKTVKYNLNLHEYQSKELMDKFGVNIQNWRLITDPQQAINAAKELNAEEIVVKAQVHAGGRGKGHFTNGYKGGVKLCKSGEEAMEISNNMLGSNLITKQTPPEGVPVNKIMICESLDFGRELYFAILLDRAHQGPVMVASPQGGMDIEAVAEETPEAIFTVPIDIQTGPTDQQTKDLAIKLGFQGDSIARAQDQMQRLYKLFVESDATQVEINPLVETTKGDVYCVDAKINFDDSAQYRQKEIFNYRDVTEEDPREVEASKSGLNYVGMDGNIGCMVNGAGLAMATMDIIKLHGGEPANFLDVGGGASENQVKEAFKLVTSDPKVQAILVNIFGGIVRCDVIANGIINACKELTLDMPLVVRLAGTNVDKGYALLNESGLDISTADDLEQAASKAVASLK
eukprot:TRINITY_DN1654_c0_g1_i2.p1 TRINITY_DN1654_c0_g1~~TRINITY_DN1654_c0_g1_i2.p1  ORF type:complete len:426 (+),score=202.38 TRINITY_DN1654_c0_g1_i2:50-1327(+)